MDRKRKRPFAQMRAKTATRKTTRKTKPKRTKPKKTKPKAAGAASGAQAKSSREKVRAYRKRMRAKGLRLIQMWLPDMRTREFANEARRQSLLANASPYTGEDQAWVDSISDWNPN
jgi:hypothetical protein